MEYGRIALSKEGVFGGRSDFSGNRMIVGDRHAYNLRSAVTTPKHGPY